MNKITEDKKEKIEKLAKDILRLSCNTLLVNLRFLDMALSQFELFPIEDSTILTDGKYLLYNPSYILKRYMTEKEVPVRDFLHIVMHCVFKHMYMNPNLEQSYWDLACDIAVENMITELNIKSVTTKREKQQESYLLAIKQELQYVTAEKIYVYLREKMPNQCELEKIRDLFYSDDHTIWYMSVYEIKIQYGLSQREDQAKGVRGKSAMAKFWQQIAERMQVDLMTFGKKRGFAPGALTQNLKAVTCERYDYATFLKKFAVMGEAMKINDDEFDYIFYTYGLQLYKKMPLIEPLEYKEIKAIKEFVIAIDTSGSTSGDLVQRFVQKTYNILKSTESFFTKINLYIIQCDAEIQEIKKITNQKGFDHYLKTMKIHGLGGTDFRPVFEYVEKLRQKQEFLNLKGMIYFTDGYGEFPVKKPDFETAFVFVDDEYNNFDIPPWGIKLILQKDEI